MSSRQGLHLSSRPEAVDTGAIEASSLYNPDLAPVSAERRTWGTYNYAALWIAMSINIPTYLLASGMIAGGMDWKQAIFTVFLGNVLVLIPMLLNAHAGARYGIPFPVFARASFGVLGANVPALLRALVACGWFGINTWIGGQAISAMLIVLHPQWSGAHLVPVCFALFALLHVVVIACGIRTIRWMQGITAPFLLAIGVALLAWALIKAGGFGPMLSSPSKFRSFAEFFRFFVPSLTGVVGFWATVALNIPDFTRYARSQKAQMLGQALGLPTTMTLYSFIGIAVTSATVVIFGQAIWDPVAVLTRLGNPVAVVVAMLALLLATLNVNVAANLVSPSNDFSNLAPRLISFRTGGMIACLVGAALFQPWKLLANYNNYITGWLVGYSGFLGPIAGVMICDYFVVRKTKIIVRDLYQHRGAYEFTSGVNLRAVAALAAGATVAFIGLVVPPLRGLYDYAWFVGFAVSFVVYYALMRKQPASESRGA